MIAAAFETSQRLCQENNQISWSIGKSSKIHASISSYNFITTTLDEEPHFVAKAHQIVYAPAFPGALSKLL
jgi:hypothetical protein